MILTRSQELVLRACNGEVVNERIDGRGDALDFLVAEGLARRYYDDDQPTAEATVAGKVLLSQIGPRK